LLSRPRRLIATLLIGNEVVNVSVSALLAAMAPTLYPGRSEVELALLTTFTALPILLLLGEITPKTVAIKTAGTWSRAVAWPLWLFSVLVTPIRSVVLLIADVILRPLGGSTRQGILRDLSEDEFRSLVDAGSAEGAVDARERRFIHRVFEFGDKTVGQVMEPREKIFALSYDLPLSRLAGEVAERGYSRVPIYRKSLDHVRGILLAKDLVVQTVVPGHRRLGDLLHEPLFVPHTLRVERLFRLFKQRRIHMALVVNEYGKLIGLVTMEDLLEELFGEIRDEREQQKAQARQRLAASRASMTRDELKELDEGARPREDEPEPGPEPEPEPEPADDVPPREDRH
jgi:putative hemolysin